MKRKRVFKKRKPLNAGLDQKILQLQSQYETLTYGKDVIKRFEDFPLSENTLRGLSEAKFVCLTDIQRESIGPALQGKDVLGSAITGSGKTLAFLIPILEHLYIAKWSRSDGVAAVIISPTRELAYQIFETLKKIGKYHDFSAGLIIGGKNLKFERTRMDQCNILICTPGRLLQHMDQNPLFNGSTLEMLVLDEADRCLDMGFEQTLNAIIGNFPSSRQTLLFSATQTSSVKDLVRLNLKAPVYIGQQEYIDNKNIKYVPDLLQQSYVVVAMEDKITMLWSFIKNHLKMKIIVFLSSCKQVKYIYEMFCKLRPGTSLLALYGTLHQERRIAIYNDFVRKNNVVLFATDIASRGLDFPSVNWVIQLDCPEDVTQYIHRAGRSARNNKRGECLLVLTPSEEEGMINELSKMYLIIRKIQIDSKKLFSPRSRIESFLAQNPELKATAQRAFVAYIKSLFVMKNKKVFNICALNFDAYARSLGLVTTPRVRFLERYLNKQKINIDYNEESSFSEEEISNNFKSKRKQSKIGNSPKENFTVISIADDSAESDEIDDLITLKRANHEIVDNPTDDCKIEMPQPVLRNKKKLVTKTSLAKKVLKKNLQMNEKVKFDQNGEEIKDNRAQLQSSLAKGYKIKELSLGGINIEMVKELLHEEDKFDKKRFRELVKHRHKSLKKRLKNHDQKETKYRESRSTAENSVDSGDDDSSLDLSWLPDPDTKESIPGLEANNFKNVCHHQTKRVLNVQDNINNYYEYYTGPSIKKSKITSKLNLNDAEVIATQLLTK